MKNAQPQALSQPKPGKKMDRQNQRPQPLYTEASQKHRLLQPHHPVHIVKAQGLGHEHPLLEADAPAQQENKQCRHGHKPQAADFNQAQQHPLAKAGPLGPGIEGGQARYTGGRGGRKQGRQKWAALPIPGGDGPGQQKGAQRDYQNKAQCDNLHGAQGFSPPFPEPNQNPIS